MFYELTNKLDKPVGNISQTVNSCYKSLRISQFSYIHGDIYIMILMLLVLDMYFYMRWGGTDFGALLRVPKKDTKTLYRVRTTGYFWSFHILLHSCCSSLQICLQHHGNGYENWEICEYKTDNLRHVIIHWWVVSSTSSLMCDLNDVITQKSEPISQWRVDTNYNWR